MLMLRWFGWCGFLIRQEPVECLFSFICSSNNNIPRITLMLRRLRERYGTPLVRWQNAAHCIGAIYVLLLLLFIIISSSSSSSSSISPFLVISDLHPPCSEPLYAAPSHLLLLWFLSGRRSLLIPVGVFAGGGRGGHATVCSTQSLAAAVASSIVWSTKSLCCYSLPLCFSRAVVVSRSRQCRRWRGPRRPSSGRWG
jgi:hypothetical protein